MDSAVSRQLIRFVAAFVALGGASSASAGEPEAERSAYVLPSDPVLEQLIEESLSARPELKAAEALVRAERAVSVQAGALPDPTLSLGIQNDGFTAIEIGKMETSFWSVMVAQTFPWPGKLRLRTEIARLGADVAGTDVKRVALATEAEVRRAYLDLLLVRERQALLERLRVLWTQSGRAALARYEAGEGSQADVLRSQLERGRIQQRRWALDADERIRIETLNRLRAHPLDEPIETPVRLRELPDPVLGPYEALLADARERSPELASARLNVNSAERSEALARKSYLPDVTVNAGIMPRGDLPPMWTANVSIPLPVFAGRKQARAVEEQQARIDAGRERTEEVLQVIALRAGERNAAWASLRETVQLYRTGLLVQSSATAESTLAQYQVGRAGFASVLEAIAGYINDEEAYAAALADLHRIAILQAEVSLDPVAALGGSSSAGAPSRPIAAGSNSSVGM